MPDTQKPGTDRTTLNLALSKADKAFLKSYAARQNMTIAKLIAKWIAELRNEETQTEKA